MTPIRRVLHVIDQVGETGPTLTLRFTADLARQAGLSDGSQHAWLLLGGEPLRDAARLAGIDASHCRLLPAPRRLPVPGAMNAAKRLLAQADEVRCWTPSAASLVSGLGRSDAVSCFGQVTLSKVTRGVIGEAYQAIRSDETGQDIRRQARHRWGVPDEAVVIALLADRPGQLDIGPLMLSMMFIHESLDAIDSPHGDVRLVVHPQTLGRMSAVQLAELLHFDDMVIQDAGLQTPWDTLPGSDVVVAPSPMDAALSIAWAEAAGLPIIAAPEPRLPGLEAVHELVTADGSQTKQLAKAMYDWVRVLPDRSRAAGAMA